MFNDLSFIARTAWASVLGSGCMLAALMWTHTATDAEPSMAAEQLVSAQQATQRPPIDGQALRGTDRAVHR